MRQDEPLDETRLGKMRQDETKSGKMRQDEARLGKMSLKMKEDEAR